MIYDISPVNNYKGNNSSTQFEFDFYIDNETQLDVFHYDKEGLKTKLIYNKDYSINEIKNPNGSFINFPLEDSEYAILSNDEYISLELTLPISQETQYNNSSLLNLETLEYSLDYLTRLIQIYSRKFALCVKVDECSNIAPNELMQELNDKALLAKNCAKQSNIILNDLNTQLGSFNVKYDNFVANSDKLLKIDEHELNKANKTDVDGQWVYYGVRIATDINLKATTNFAIDLSDVLPDDGYEYECCFNVDGQSFVHDTQFELQLLTPAGFLIRCGHIFNYGNGKEQTISGNGILPIGLDRMIYLKRYDWYTGTAGVRLEQYRRIGKNV